MMEESGGIYSHSILEELMRINIMGCDPVVL